MPSVAYNPVDDSFLTAWSANIKTGPYSPPYSIFTRKVTIRGKPLASVHKVPKVEVYINEPFQVAPVLHSLPAASSSQSNGAAAYLLVWSETLAGNGGLVAAFLDADGLIIRAPDIISNGYLDERNVPWDIFCDASGNFCIVHAKDADDTRMCGHVTRFSPGGVVLGEKRFSKVTGYHMGGISLSRKLMLVSYTDEFYEAHNQFLRKTLKPKKDSFLPIDDGSVHHSSFVKINEFDGIVQLCLSDGFTVTARLWSARGKAIGMPEIIYTDDHTIALSLESVAIPESRSILLVYTSSGQGHQLDVSGLRLDIPLPDEQK
jgi:hypothetical protein